MIRYDNDTLLLLLHNVVQWGGGVMIFIVKMCDINILLILNICTV